MHAFFLIKANKPWLLLVLSLGIITSCRSEKPDENQHSTTTSYQSIIKISLNDDPAVLDPRQARDLNAVTLMHMLFEGLMRHHIDGKLIPALAEKVTISPDLKIYTFTLRESKWSNDDPVTAEDFAYSWKRILDPEYPAPNAYQFFDIKGAKESKEGKIPPEEIGIYALDHNTLVVELEKPVPYFLELLAFHPFFPVNHRWEKLHPNWMNGSPGNFVSNGPFKLTKWAYHNVLVVEKNLHYWDATAVHLDQIVMMILEENTAFQMFQLGALDWTGSPLSILPPDAIATLNQKGSLHIAPAAGTHWFRFNVEKFPLNHPKIRTALSYAINRQAIADHILQGKQTPATHIIPPSLMLSEPFFKDHDILKAQHLLQEALDELDMVKAEFAPITLSYKNDERIHKIAQAVQQQIEKNLQIPIHLESHEGKIYLDKIAHHDYQMASGSWFADFRDPINFLEIFKYKSNPTNNTQWENPEFIALLENSANEPNPEKRLQILKEAEAILIKEMPIIPLFFYTFNYVKNEFLKGVYFSDLGYLDFKYSYIQDSEI